MNNDFVLSIFILMDMSTFTLLEVDGARSSEMKPRVPNVVVEIR